MKNLLSNTSRSSLLIVGVGFLFLNAPASASDRHRGSSVSFGLSFGNSAPCFPSRPVYYSRHSCSSYPRYYSYPPRYVVYDAPVVYQPAPVVIRSQPVIYESTRIITNPVRVNENPTETSSLARDGHDWAKDLRDDIVTRDEFVNYLKKNISKASSADYNEFRRGFIDAYGVNGEAAFTKAYNQARNG